MKSMNCPEVEKCLELIHLILDDEATVDQKEYLEKHLELCRQCLENFNIEKELRIVLKNKLNNKTVPQSLVSEIEQRIAEIG